MQFELNQFESAIVIKYDKINYKTNNIHFAKSFFSEFFITTLKSFSASLIFIVSQPVLLTPPHKLSWWHSKHISWPWTRQPEFEVKYVTVTSTVTYAVWLGFDDDHKYQIQHSDLYEFERRSVIPRDFRDQSFSEDPQLWRRWFVDISDNSSAQLPRHKRLGSYCRTNDHNVQS